MMFVIIQFIKIDSTQIQTIFDAFFQKFTSRFHPLSIIFMEEEQARFNFTVSKDKPFVLEFQGDEDAVISSVTFKEGSEITETKFLVEIDEFDEKETNELCTLSKENKEEELNYIFSAENKCTFKVEGDGVIFGSGIIINAKYNPEDNLNKKEKEEENMDIFVINDI